MDQVLNQPIKDPAGNIIGYASGATPADVSAISNTITSSHLTPSSQTPYTTPTPSPTYPVGSLDTTVPTPPAAPTAAEGEANSLTASLKALNDSLIGKSAYQASQEAAAGIPDITKTITDLSSQLKGLQNEATAIPLQLQNEATGRGITAAGLAPISSAQLRDNATKALTVSTLLEAAKGNLSTAQANADRAVAQKYGPIQEQIDAAKANLALVLNSPEYTLEEKNRAQQQLDLQNARQAKLDHAKANTTAINTVAITAAQNSATFKPTTQYPTVSMALNAITQAASPALATQIATDTGLVAPKKLDTQVVEVNGRKLLVDSNTGKTIKDLGAAPKSSTSTGTEAERAAASVARYSSAFVPGARTADGTPIIDTNGYLTPAAFKSAIADAPANGLSREDFLKAFGYLLYTSGGAIDPKYGLTAAEQKIVVGALPGA